MCFPSGDQEGVSELTSKVVRRTGFEPSASIEYIWRKLSSGPSPDKVSSELSGDYSAWSVSNPGCVMLAPPEPSTLSRTIDVPPLTRMWEPSGLHLGLS